MNKKVNEIFQDAQCAFFDMDQGVQDLKKLLQVDDKNKQVNLKKRQKLFFFKSTIII